MKQFSFNTIDNFDDHIKKSIPSYDLLTEMILNLSGYFIQEGENVYDMGCSTGTLLKKMSSTANKIGYDNSNLIPTQSYKNMQFIRTDLTKGFDITNACLVTSVFTMQFLPKKHRQEFCQRIYDGLNKGGAFILCEKVYSQNSSLQEAMSMCYYQHKSKDFTVDEILSKEKDLREIMKPYTLVQNIEILNNAGFKKIEFFWRFYNFVGLICIKD